MQLSEEVKKQIEDILDYNEAFTKTLYVDNNGDPLDEKKREELGQFYTPAKICIQMIEKFNFDTLAGKNILDPTCGSGNLLIACLIAGADSDKVFGNEYDADIIPTCRKRINTCCDLIGKPHISDWQIHQGNALHEFALTEFIPDYDSFYFWGSKNIDDLTETKVPGSVNLKMYYHDQQCFERIKDKYPEDYKQYELGCSAKIEKYNQETILNKPFEGDLWS